MFRPLSAYIGLRYSTSNKNKGFISFISASSTIGIALGVMVLIIGLSAMNGFEYELKNRILAVVPNAELESVNNPISHWQKRNNELMDMEEVVATAPFIKINGLLQKNNELKAVQIRAVDAELESQVSSIANYVNEGSWNSLNSTENRLVLGRGIAGSLNVEVGDSVTVLLSQSNSTSFKSPRRIPMKVSGIIHLSGQLDNNLAYMPLVAAQVLKEQYTTVDGFSLKVTDLFRANEVVAEAGQVVNHYVYLRSWMTTQGAFYQDIQMVKSLMYIILILVIAVACFNIITTLVMAVDDKRADIAILKTMGASNTLLRLIFVFHGCVNGIFGVVSGSVLGTLIATNLTALITFLEGLTGKHVLSGDIYFIDFLPTQVHMTDIIVVSTAALIMCVFSTLYPANKACNIQPARELGNK